MTSQGQDEHRRKPSRMAVLMSAAVHLFTALGVVCALAAIVAVHQGNYAVMFAWLGLAFFIDGVDGTFARLVGVHIHLPRFSGAQLDLVIDYITYVLVPVLALLHAGHLPGSAGFVLASLILLSSLYHFSDLASKTDDHCFVGFPAIWNIVAFYIFAFAPPAALTAIIVIALVVLTFIPMRWLHPMRFRRLRGLNITLLGLWFAAAAEILYAGFPAALWAKLVLAAVALYAVALTFSLPLAKTIGTSKP